MKTLLIAIGAGMMAFGVIGLMAMADARELCKFQDGPRIGQTKAQVLASKAIATCWGPIYRTNTLQTANGISEMLIYRAGDWRGYVYLTNGIVTAISQ
jgi:hypothetical protein